MTGSGLTKTILAYALAIAIGVFLLEWVQYQYLARRFGFEIFLALIALGFGGLGLWLGVRLTARPPAKTFEKNTAALQTLGISEREYDVLAALAKGISNKEIARDLGVSPNTIKTHLQRLFDKLEVTRRAQAVDKARQLRLVP
jgi:DNA-binding NarL/FixJ family response regulator